MQITNSGRQYGTAAVALHWLMAGIILALVGLGLYMVRLPDAGFDAVKITLIIVHKQIGMIALGLLLLRWLWRQINPLPPLVATIPQWQQVAAIVVHLSFYALMLALPVTGWLMSSYAGIPVLFFGTALPDPVPQNAALFGMFRQIHDYLGYAIGVLVCLHAGAALHHHFLLRDRTLHKMLGA
jgi:cytochrome b561